MYASERSPGPPRLLMDLALDELDDGEAEMAELLLRADGLTKPPPWVLRRDERIARRYQSTRSPHRSTWDSGWRRTVASIAFDSRVQPQFAGLRAGLAQVRRLLFQAENLEVDLEMRPGPLREQVRLAGQVTAAGANPHGGLLRLSTPDREQETLLDECGEFWIDGLERGTYRLEIVFAGRLVEIPVLPI